MSTIQLWAPPYLTPEMIVEKVHEFFRRFPTKPVRFVQDYIDSTWPSLWHLKTTFDITIDGDTVSSPSNTVNCEPCAICHAALRHGLEQLQCQHVFHTMCIHRWLQYASTCPVCRREL